MKTGEKKFDEFEELVLELDMARIIFAEEEEEEEARIVVSIKDITERKRAESQMEAALEALQKSEEKYRNIFNDAILGIYQTTPEGRILSTNPALAQMFGYDTPEELTNVTTTQIYANPEDREIFKGILSKDGVVEKFETRFRKKGGEIIWVSINACIVKDRQGNISNFEGTIEDITERKRAEEALRESQEQLRDAHRLAHIGIWNWIAETDTVTWTEELYRIAGLDPMIPAPTYAEHFNIYAPESWDRLKLAAERALETGAPYQLELKLIRPDGTTRWVNAFGGTTYDNHGLVTGLHGTLQDITDRKRAEEKLRESEENFRRSLEDSPLGVRIVTIEGETIYTNRAILDIYSYDSIEELKTTPVKNRYTPECYAEFQTRREKRKRGENDPSEYEISIVRKDGEVRRLHVFRKEISWDGEKQFQVIYHDITKRKHAEEKLRYERQRFSVLSENAPFGMAMIDKDGGFVYSNPKFKEILGYDLSDIPDGKTWFTKAFPDSVYRHTVISTWAEDLKGVGPGEKRSRVFTVTCKDGTEKIINFIMVQMEIGVRIMTCEDITVSKQAEEALVMSEALLREAQRVAHIGHWELDTSTMTPAWSEEIFHIFGLDPEEGEPSFEAHRKVTRPDGWGILNNAVTTSIAEGIPFDIEFRILRPDKTIRWIHAIGYPKKDNEGRVISVFGTAQDITDRKLVEDALHASLDEKEILLREVHHRVKNNMQVISGLLDLQARSIGNPELTEMLNEGQRRIRSMAMIHEELYGSKDFSRIDLAGYAKTLSQELFQAYKINPGRIDLIIQTDGEVYVDINKAIPCGLILNELVSNVLKHAFPGDKPGTLEIIIRETKNTELEILVRDNGSGIPDDVDIHQPHSVGLHLVNGLVIHQLDGHIEVIRDTGTEFRIAFPI